MEIFDKLSAAERLPINLKDPLQQLLAHKGLQRALKVQNQHLRKAVCYRYPGSKRPANHGSVDSSLWHPWTATEQRKQHK